jgi:hypothetical protein
MCSDRRSVSEATARLGDARLTASDRRVAPSPRAISVRAAVALLVRRRKGGRRREVGIDTWGWEELQPWLERRLQLPVGPLLCVIKGPTRGRYSSRAAARADLRRTAVAAGAPALCDPPPTPSSSRERVPVIVIQRQLGRSNLGIT